MLKFDVKFDDDEMYKEIKRQARKQVLTVGFFDETYPDGKRIGRIATINEYGVPEHNQPPRPFMRYTVIKNKPKWLSILQDILPQNMDIKRSLNILGDVVADDVSQMITAFAVPPNRPSTIARKGFNDPLVETGLMRDSVGWKVGRE